MSDGQEASEETRGSSTTQAPARKRLHKKGTTSDSEGGRGDANGDEADDFEDDPSSQQAQAALETISGILNQLTDTGPDDDASGGDDPSSSGGASTSPSPSPSPDPSSSPSGSRAIDGTESSDTGIAEGGTRKTVPEIREGTRFEEFSSEQATRSAAHAIQNNSIRKENWQQWNDFFDHMTEAELEEAALIAVSRTIERDEFGFSPSSYGSSSLTVSGDSPRLVNPVRTNVASCLTRIGRGDPERQRNFAARLISEAPDGETDSTAKLAATWCPDPEVRRSIYQEHNSDWDQEQRGHNQFTMQFSDSHEDRAEALISRFVTSGRSAQTQFVRASLQDFGPARDGDISQFTGGLAVESITPTSELRETVETLRAETAAHIENKHDGEITLWRGVENEVTANASLESWTSARHTAKKYDGHAVLKATFEPGDVLATHEIDAHSEWGYGRYPTEREWTVLGGAISQSLSEDPLTGETNSDTSTQ